MQGDRFEIETTIKIDGSNDISYKFSPSSKTKGLKGTYCSVGTMPDTPPVVTVSLCSSAATLPAAPFPLTTVPFTPAPLGVPLVVGMGKVRSDV